MKVILPINAHFCKHNSFGKSKSDCLQHMLKTKPYNMTTFNRSRFKKLSEFKGANALSIYIPVEDGGNNRNKAMTKLKNHVQDAEKELETMGWKPREIEVFLKPINGLLNDATMFRNLNKSLAVFRSESNFEYYSLPIEVEEFSLVSDVFHLLPLLPYFNKKDSFFIFSFSQNQNRLFEATQQDITELDTGDDFPSKIQDSVGKDTVSLDVNIRSVGSRGKSGETYYYGKGETDADDRELRLYLEDIDRGLTNIIGTDGDPLVIASVESSYGHFKEYSSYNNIYPEYISGNVEEESAHTLHERAKEILQPYFNETRTDKKEALVDGEVPQISDLKEIIIAADVGKIGRAHV